MSKAKKINPDPEMERIKNDLIEDMLNKYGLDLRDENQKTEPVKSSVLDKFHNTISEMSGEYDLNDKDFNDEFRDDPDFDKSIRYENDPQFAEAQEIVEKVSRFFYCMFKWGRKQNSTEIFEKVMYELPHAIHDRGINNSSLSKSVDLKIKKASEVNVNKLSANEYIMQVSDILFDGLPYGFNQEMSGLLSIGIELYTLRESLIEKSIGEDMLPNINEQIEEIKEELTDLIYEDLKFSSDSNVHALKQQEPEHLELISSDPKKQPKQVKGNIIPVRYSAHELEKIDKIVVLATESLGVEVNRSWVLRELLKMGYDDLLKRFKERG